MDKLGINPTARTRLKKPDNQILTHMPTSGYSGTPLLKKLGLKEGQKIWLLDPPEEYFQLLDKDISSWICGRKECPDWVHLFAPDSRAFERRMRSLVAVIRKNPRIVIWVSWYKKSSGMATDLTEDVIRGYALSNGLVDIKVCAVSELWSGLKLVVPLNKR